MAETSFGWITQIAAKDGANAETLMEENITYIQALRPPFDTLWFEDHLQWGDIAVLEAWSTLTSMAAIFPQMRCGSLVSCQSFRNPALLAKMAASIQTITQGRLIVGIGAGWKEDEYQAYGFPFPPTNIRLEQLEETSMILKKCGGNHRHPSVESIMLSKRPIASRNPILPLHY